MQRLRGLARSRRFAAIFSAAVILVLVGTLVLNLVHPGSKAVAANDANAYTVALGAPISGELSEFAHEQSASLQLYLDQLNATGGLNGHAVHLQVFDDRDDPTYAPKVAQQVADSRALAVIGHFTSSISLPASPVYKQNGVPAVTGTSTTDALTLDNPFYFRATYTNSSYGTQLSGYVANQLGAQHMVVIASDDAFGHNLADGYIKGFPGTVVKTWYYDDTPDKREASRRQILDELARTPDPGPVMMAMIEVPGSQFIMDMKRRGMTMPIIGSDSFAGVPFYNLFNNEPEQKAKPGFFTDGLYAPTNFFVETANGEAQQFALTLQRTAHVQLTYNGASAVDALKMALTAIGKAKLTNTAQSKAADRLAVRDALNALKNPQNAVSGLSGPLYFDNQNNLPVPVLIGSFSGPHFIPAPVQYIAAVNVSQEDLAAQKTAGTIVDVNNLPAWKQQVVYTGISVNQATRIDTSKNSSFFADFYLWLRYQGSDSQVLSFDFPDATNSTIYKATEPEAASIVNGLNYRLYHIRGEFKASFDFHDFPFDQQYLNIRFNNVKTPRQRVIYVVDQVGLDPTNDNTPEQVLKLRQSLNSWYFMGLNYGADATESRSKRGNIAMEGSYTASAFSGFHTTMVLRRNVVAFLVKNLLPLGLLMAILYATLFFSVSLTKERLTIAVTAVLTSAVLLSAVGSQLSDATYTVAIEYIFYAFFGLCFMCLLVGVVRERFHQRKQEDVARLIDRVAIIVYPLIVVGIIAVYVVHYATFFTGASGG